MAWASEGESGDEARHDVEFTPIGSTKARHRSLRPAGWLVAGAAVGLVTVAILWQSGDGGDPSAVATPTDVTSSSTTTTESSTNSTSIPPLLELADVGTTPVDQGRAPQQATSTTIPRPVVPASTSTLPRTTAAPTTTIVVSADAADDAPRVSVVEGDTSEAVVVEAVPNTALDAADRSSPASTVPVTTTGTLPCTGTEEVIDLIGHIDAEAADGGSAALAVTAAGVGVAGGRDPDRVDYAAEQGASERLFADLGRPRCAIVVELDDLVGGEWEGHAESAHWVGLDADNQTVGEGWLVGGTDQSFSLQLTAPIEHLLLEAAPYGATPQGWPAGADRVIADNSEFVVVSIAVR